MKTLKYICALIAIVFITGCASIPTQNFSSLLHTTREASEAIDKVLQENYKLESGIIREEIILDERPLYDVFLERQGSYSIKPEISTPMLESIETARSALSDINDLAIEYMELLATLSGANNTPKDHFIELAESFNDTSTAITDSLNVDLGPDTLPTLSVAGSEVLRLMLEGKRRKLLLEVLEGNQPVIEEYCAFAIELIDKIEISLYHSYSKYFARIDDQLFYEDNAEERRIMVNRAYELNGRYVNALKALESVRKIYEQIPEAHGSLSTFKYSRGVKLLVKYGKELSNSYEDLF